MPGQKLKKFQGIGVLAKIIKATHHWLTCGHSTQFQVDSIYKTVLLDSSGNFREISLTHLRARLFFAC